MDENNIAPSKVDIETFKKAITNMIATTDTAYDSRYARKKSVRARPYTTEEIKDIISSGSLSQQVTLSNSYFALDGYYRRIIIYYATFLKYVGVLIPEYQGKATKQIIDTYNKAMNFINLANMYSICSDFAIKALTNGTYYGVVQRADENGFAILDLPFNYCSTRYKDQQNNDLIEFDLSYFESISDKKQRRIALEVYPDVIKKAYKKWQNKRTYENQFYLIPSDVGICFPLFDGRPMFLSTLQDISDYYDYKDYDKERVQEDIRKILVQKVPHNSDGSLTFEPDEAEEMHRGTVQMLKGNKNVSVLTTYADVDVHSSDTTNASVNNILDTASTSIYKQAGVSPQVFAMVGNIAVEVSIQKDGALCMYMANKFATFFTTLVNSLFANENIKFKYSFLDVSHYNEKQYIENSFKLASSGYSFLLPALAMGMNQSDFSNIKSLENDILKLDKKLKPLQSSYTQSGSGSPGAPAKEAGEKSERTLENEKSKEGGGTE